MKIKNFIILVLACFIFTNIEAKKKPMPDEILKTVIHNDTEYKMIRTWWKNSKGSYNPTVHVLANNEIILTQKYGNEFSFWEIDGHLFFYEWPSYSMKIYDSQGKQIQSNIKYPNSIRIRNFADIERPLIRFSNAHAESTEGEETEYFSLEGKPLIPIHTKVNSFFKGQKKYYLLSTYNTEGLMDDNFNFIFPVKEKQEIQFDKDSTFFICRNITTTIYNPSTCEILPYTSLDRINGTKLYIVGKNNSFGIYDSEHNSEILPPHYEKILPTSKIKDYVTVGKDNLWGIVNIYGKEIIPINYQSIILNDTHLAIIKRNNNFGIYNMLSSSEIIPPDFEEIEIIDYSLVKYKLNGYWGVMNLDGKEIIPTTRGYTSINYVKGLKKFTYSMYGYKGECNSLGTQLSKIAVPTNNNPSNNTASSTHNHNESTAVSNKASQQQGNQVREYIETVPVQIWQACGSCNGSGQCSVCYGSGWTIGYNGNKRSCTACHGTGKCTSCAGHGGQNVVRYEQRTVYR